MEKLYEVVYSGLMLSIYDDYLSIQPKGFLGFTREGLKGERKIFYKDITSVQFKASNKLFAGFIEFYFAGSNTHNQGGGLISGTDNENRFYFYNKDLQTMIKINEFIEQKIRGTNNNSNSQQSDNISELKNLKLLLDEGLITQEDYDAKKKKILNL